MAGINPVSGITPPIASSGIGVEAGKKPSAAGSDFSNVLRDYLGKVDGDQQASSKAIQDLLAGKSDDVLPVVAAVAKADMSFKLLIGVRNKVIEAYKQTMNMQI